MPKPLRTIEIRREEDIIRARQLARKLAELVGLDPQDCVRIATSVSEIARNALAYAGKGRADYLLRKDAVIVRIRDEGPGIARLAEVLSGTYRSTTGMGLGIVGSQRLMDEFKVESGGKGTVVTLGKRIPTARKFSEETVMREFAAASPEPAGEIREQNLELLRTLQEVRDRQEALTKLNEELEETNRGVVALYSELDEKGRSLQRASEVKTRFLSHMSHEFRTPVVSILALARMLIERADGELTPEQEKQVSFILKAAENLQEMVNDLLDLAKVEAGKLSVRSTTFEATELFATLRGMLKPILPRQSDVELIFELAPGLPKLETDEGKLAQILRNFISNAVKFTERGEIRVEARLEGDAHMFFSVSDTGVGIEREHLETIFEEFAQIEGPHQGRAKGTGLGLPLARNLARLLGGTVSVESVIGTGSKFSALIPLRYHEAAPPAALSTKWGANNVVLVIDDDEISRYLLVDVLRQTSYRVIEAPGGKDGIPLAHHERPRAIFLDLIMPEMSGFRVLDELKRDPHTRDIPVIINTTKIIEPDDERLLSGKVAAIIKKDFSSREEASRIILDTLKKIGDAGKNPIAHG